MLRNTLRNTKIEQKNSNSLLFLFPLVFCLLIFLTGCVNYDVGINFNSPHQGNIVQHINIKQQLNNLDRNEVKKWLNSLESRSRQLQGKVKKLNSEELLLTIPFHNGQELVSKFNQLFHSEIPVTYALATTENPDLTKLNSQINLQQSNLILLERNSLDLIIDLRALNILTHQGKIFVDSDRLIDLEFQLNTPWLAYSVSGDNNLQPIAHPKTKQLVWHLQPGEINHIKAVFWLPSPLGLGTVAIIIVTLLGFYLKYQRFPGIAA
jgi:hypothetical protein